MNPLFFLPIVLLAGIGFMIFMNKKHKSSKETINLDALRMQYPKFKNELLAHDFSKLSGAMKGDTIDAFTSVSIPKTTNNPDLENVNTNIKNMELSKLGKQLMAIETECFVVLSGTDLHFFSTTSLGEIEQHIVFDYFTLTKGTLNYKGILKAVFGVYSKASEEYLPKTHLLSIPYKDSFVVLEIHDRLHYTVDPQDLLNVKKQLDTRAKYQVVGEQFIIALQKKFSNLQN